MTFLPRPLPAALALCALAAAAALPAQSGNPTWAPMPNPDPRLAALAASPATRLRAPTRVAISPDGALLAWTISSQPSGGRQGLALHLTDPANPDPAKDKIISPNADTACSNGSPVWAPDSQTLAFTSTCTGKEAQPAQPQIFLWSRASGDIKQLTHLTGIFEQAAFSPDGKALAFLFVENATRSAGALAAMKPWSGVIGEDGVEVQRVYAVDLATAHGSWITPLTLHVFEFTFNPRPTRSPTSAPTRPAKTTGGSPSSTPRPSASRQTP